MKIEKLEITDGIRLENKSVGVQNIYFDSEQERDIVFDHWSKAIAELNKSKAIYRPVYEGKNGEIRILSLRYTTPEEAMEVELTRRQHFGEGMKLVAIYNEAERSFQ